MSVDYGAVRTGIAVCDVLETLASPVTVITEYHFDRLPERIAEEAKKLRAEHIVVGLPRNMDGSEGESAQKARDLARLIEEKTGLDVSLYDERCSTVLAHNILSANDVRGKKRKNTVDSVAAVIILESFMAKRKNNNGVNNNA